MAIQGMYENILREVLEDIEGLKNKIIKTWGYKDFKVKIEGSYYSIKDDRGNNAFGVFYREENIIKISYTELTSFVGLKICNENLNKIGVENCKKIFLYYVFYVVAHELHHAYLYNVSKEEYFKIKKEDEGLDYKESKLEREADKHAIKYLETSNIMAGEVSRLAVKLREGKYNVLKLEDETIEESRNRLIDEEIEKIINIINN